LYHTHYSLLDDQVCDQLTFNTLWHNDTNTQEGTLNINIMVVCQSHM